MSPTPSPIEVLSPAVTNSVAVTTHFPDSVPDLLAGALAMVRGGGLGGVTGRLVEENSGGAHTWRLVLECPLSEEDGDSLIGLFLPDRSESPPWE